MTKKKADPYSNFKKLNKAKQIEFMRQWFGERYEDPAQHTPYDSREGGYIWVYGGPFNAEEVLRDEFGESAKKDAVEELAEELSDECPQWTRTPSYNYELFPPDEDYYSQEFDSISEDFEHFLKLDRNLDSLLEMLEQLKGLKPAQRSFSEMMIFSFCVTLMESYLSDVFAKIVLNNSAVKKSYLKNDKQLAGRKVSLGDLFEQFENIDGTVKKRISETSFHNLALIKSLFQAVFGIDVGEIEDLAPLIAKRHDFVHRGGKNTSGESVSTNAKEIEKLVNLVRKFCHTVNSELEIKELISPAPY